LEQNTQFNITEGQRIHVTPNKAYPLEHLEQFADEAQRMHPYVKLHILQTLAVK
jgi:hypothetical protein